MAGVGAGAGATSVLVPPMSSVIPSPRPLRPANHMAARAPAAGPESSILTAFRLGHGGGHGRAVRLHDLQHAAVAAHPQLGVEPSDIARDDGPTKAFAIVVSARSYSRNSGEAAWLTDSANFGAGSRIRLARACSCAGLR